jgi:phosphoribosylamine---glycine ligase
MNILVIGSGGREHALIKSFKKSMLSQKIFALPGNDGMGNDAILVDISQKNFAEIISFCKSEKIDFVFIGPEEPLVNGLSDALREHDILCIGPSKTAAQLEGSKIFAKNFMNQAHIPTAKSFVVTTVEDTVDRAQSFLPPYILKADGLAAGKGVFICKTIDELKSAATDLFIHNKLGSAGHCALLEENLPGKELSFLILTNGKNFEALPLAKDHKRLMDNDMGPNTGGMGTVAPMKISDVLYQKIIDQIIKPSVLQIEKQNLLFRGILFVGIMVVNDQPYALEYNTRFGDPETQVILPLIENDTCELFLNLSKGILNSIQQNNLYAACIVNAAEGYPDQPVKNTPIFFESKIQDHLLFAAVKKTNDCLVTNGGRVLNIVATAQTQTEALKRAYSLNENIQFKNRLFRSDIGKVNF